MRKVREVLRLRFDCGRSHAEIAASAAIGETTVGDDLARARAAGLTWADAQAMTDAEVKAKLFRNAVGRNEPPARVPIDFAWVHAELARAGVTLQILWVEYREAASATKGQRPYEYSRFCDLYARWRAKLAVSMRQVHRAGEKVFIDYSGKKLRIVDAATGEVIEVEICVAVLGASNYTYAEATRSQKLSDFVGSTVRAFEYFGCVPEVVVPDQLRSAVSGPDRYEPDINPTYLEMAQHYGVTVIPARPRKPKDKSKVEGGVLIVQRWIVAALRHRTFFSLGERMRRSESSSPSSTRVPSKSSTDAGARPLKRLFVQGTLSRPTINRAIAARAARLERPSTHLQDRVAAACSCNSAGRGKKRCTASHALS